MKKILLSGLTSSSLIYISKKSINISYDIIDKLPFDNYFTSIIKFFTILLIMLIINALHIYITYLIHKLTHDNIHTTEREKIRCISR